MYYFIVNSGGVFDVNGKFVFEACEAVDRGVWFDMVYGWMNFSFDVGWCIIE